MSVWGGRVIRILAALLLASLAITAALGWQVKVKSDRVALLSERNDRLSGLIDTLNRANHDLASQMKSMADRHRQTLTLAARAEQDKRRIAAELDNRNADLRRALASQPEWSGTPVPHAIADPINAALERLRNAGARRDHQL